MPQCQRDRKFRRARLVSLLVKLWRTSLVADILFEQAQHLVQNASLATSTRVPIPPEMSYVTRESAPDAQNHGLAAAAVRYGLYA